MLLQIPALRQILTSGLACQKTFAAFSTRLPISCTDSKRNSKHACTKVTRSSDQSVQYRHEHSSSTEQNSASNAKIKASIVSTVKKYILMRRDYSKKYTANNTITAVRAMQQFLLSPSDLEKLRQIKIRSPYDSNAPIYVYLEKDVENCAIKLYGSLEAMEKERKRFQKVRKKQERQYNMFGMVLQSKDSKTELPPRLLKSGPGRVVAYAAASNAIICIFKFGCFLTTRSASMFSEVLHSLADFCNQILLLWGVNESLKKPDLKHPYGFGNMRHIMSLISGVGIFCVGCGVSIYHGVQVLLHPIGIDSSLVSSFAILFGSALIESGSLVVAIQQTKTQAKAHELSFWDYVKESRDPSTNVVLLEDSAAVLGIGIAGGALALTSLTGNPVFDGVGSLVIGCLLGAVATFLVTSNVNALIGRSIPQRKVEMLQEMLEDDAVVRGVYDIKATQLNGDEYKFKAEIDFDGREITRAYLATVDMDELLSEIHNVKTHEDLEQLILRYGEQVIDTLGAQVDRLESELKKTNKDLRHIDLEVL